MAELVAVMIDNREALAYLIYKHTNVSRSKALEVVDALGASVAAVERCLSKRWRQRRGAKPAGPRP